MNFMNGIYGMYKTDLSLKRVKVLRMMIDFWWVNVKVQKNHIRLPQ